MKLWITIRRAMFGVAMLTAWLGLAGLGCGGHAGMESGKSDDELAQTHADGTTRLEGQDDSMAASFEEKKAAADAERANRVASVPSGSTRSGPGKVDSVTVRSGDTLWKLAERKDVYGSGWLYPLIYKANQAQIKDPNNLPAGLKLRIPRDIPDPQVEIAKEQAMTNELLEQQPAATPVPRAAPMAAAKPVTPARPARRGGKAWILLLVVAAGVGAYVWRSKAKGRAEQA